MSNASSPVAVSGGHSLTIAEFCAAERMSRPFYFKLRQRGKGPRELREAGLSGSLPKHTLNGGGNAPLSTSPPRSDAQKAPLIPGPSRIPFPPLASNGVGSCHLTFRPVPDKIFRSAAAVGTRAAAHSSRSRPTTCIMLSALPGVMPVITVTAASFARLSSRPAHQTGKSAAGQNAAQSCENTRRCTDGPDLASDPPEVPILRALKSAPNRIDRGAKSPVRTCPRSTFGSA